MSVLPNTTQPTAWSVAVFAVCTLIGFSQLAYQCQATVTAGCVTHIMTTAGVPKPAAVSYEKALSRNRVQTSDLKQQPPYILRLFGIRNLGHASLLHVCLAGGAKRSPQCKAFKYCSGRGQCKLQKKTGGDRKASPYQCRCRAGFTGSACQTNACHKACQNGASCKPTSRGLRFQCSCKAGYTGQRCEKKVNRCTPNPCANGGRCRALLNDFSCECQHGYAGRRCDSHLLKESEFDKKLGRMTSAITKSVGELSKAVRAGFKTVIAQTSGVSCLRSGQFGAHWRSGVYTEDTVKGGRFKAYCDMKTDGGGWTVIQRRQDGSVDFFRNWADYKKGFGSLTGEFWLGLDKIHAMTSSGKHKLRIDMITTKGKRMAVTYSSFRVESERKKYQLHVSGFKGYGTTDNLTPHNGMYFSTKDRDHDNSKYNCATASGSWGGRWKGAWWYNQCWNSHLNGRYGRHIDWNYGTSLKFVEMKIRP